VYETALEPGEADHPRVRGEYAGFVIDGSRVRTVGVDDGGSERIAADGLRHSVSGYWASCSDATWLVNVGEMAYGELAVELK
jgi:hypothetical protein